MRALAKMLSAHPKGNFARACSCISMHASISFDAAKVSLDGVTKEKQYSSLEKDKRNQENRRHRSKTDAPRNCSNKIAMGIGIRQFTVNGSSNL